MRSIIICLVFLLAFSVTGLYAHGPGGSGHGPKVEITEAQVITQAKNIVLGIVGQGKLDPSWGKANLDEVKKKTFDGRSEWVITFNNPEEKDKEKQSCIHI